MSDNAFAAMMLALTPFIAFAMFFAEDYFGTRLERRQCDVRQRELGK